MRESPRQAPPELGPSKQGREVIRPNVFPHEMPRENPQGRELPGRARRRGPTPRQCMQPLAGLGRRHVSPIFHALPGQPRRSLIQVPLIVLPRMPRQTALEIEKRYEPVDISGKRRRRTAQRQRAGGSGSTGHGQSVRKPARISASQSRCTTPPPVGTKKPKPLGLWLKSSRTTNPVAQ